MAVFVVFALSGGAVASLVDEPVLFLLSGWVPLVAAIVTVGVVWIVSRLASQATQDGKQG